MNSVLMPSNGICLDISTQSTNGAPLKECYTSEDEHATKVRKPYTITKQRERWTEEEHKKFLEALKLYGRAWRRIEEHIGSKTAVQIRSHAQKFFSKVVRESAGSSGGSIEIPPPRPKRKPMHPYPRKFVKSSKKGNSDSEQVDRRSPSPISSVSEQENGSPSSVLCTVVSDTMGSSVSNPPNTCSSPVSSAEENRFPSSTLSAEEGNGSPSVTPVDAGSSLDDKSSKKSDLGSNDHVSAKESSLVEMPTMTLKLFGRTVLVTDAHRPASCSTVENIQQSPKPSPIVDIKAHQENSHPDPQNPVQTSPGNNTPSSRFSGGKHKGTQNPPWPCEVLSPLFNCSQFQQENPTSAEVTASLPWWALYGNLPFLVMHPHSLNLTELPMEALHDKEMHREGSWTGSNTASVSDVGIGDKNGDVVESRSGEPSDKKEMDCVPAFHLQVSENSAFSSPRPGSMNCSKGFVPYKRCLEERDVRHPQIGSEVRERQRIKIFL